jgi:glycopeptide antibiotics resistance protein
MHLSPAGKFFVFLLLMVCLAILSKFILFKKSPGYYRTYFRNEYRRYTVDEGMEKANFVPFKTIHTMQSEKLRLEFRIDNLAGNIAGFIPLGILFPLLFVSLRRFWKTTAIVFLVSLGFETTQLLTGLGVFDIDDLILNVAGGILGYIFFRIFFRKKKHPAT